MKTTSVPIIAKSRESKASLVRTCAILPLSVVEHRTYSTPLQIILEIRQFMVHEGDCNLRNKKTGLLMSVLYNMSNR